MYNFFKNRDRHTPEPERKYGMYAYSYYVVGLLVAVPWLLYFTAQDIIHPAYAVSQEQIKPPISLNPRWETIKTNPPSWKTEQFQTPEQKALELYPDPVKPMAAINPGKNDLDDYTTAVASRAAEKTRSLQADMKQWEEHTGKSFLTDHPSMKPHMQEEEKGVVHLQNYPTNYDAFVANNIKPNGVYTLSTVYSEAVITGRISYKSVVFASPSEFWACENELARARKAERGSLLGLGNPEFTSCYIQSTPEKVADYSGVQGLCFVNNREFEQDVQEPDGNTDKFFFVDGQPTENHPAPIVCGEVWREFARGVYLAGNHEELVRASTSYKGNTARWAAVTPILEEYNANLATVQAQRREYIAGLQEKTMENIKKWGGTEFLATKKFLDLEKTNNGGATDTPNTLAGSWKELLRSNHETVERARAWLLVGACVLFSLWFLMGEKWGIIRTPSIMPDKLYLWAAGLLGVYALTFWDDPSNRIYPSLWAAAWAFIPPLGFLSVPTYTMVIKEIIKETKQYQETFVEGRGKESGRWGGMLSYLKRDISRWFRASKKQIIKTKESPVYLGRTMWQYDYKLGRRDIGITSEQHLITIAGTGSGKSRDVIFNNVLSYNGGMIAFDTKGEHVKLAYERRKAYAPAYVIDPYSKAKDGITSDYWNPLDEINPDSPSARGDLKRIAGAIVPKEAGERAVDIHFREIPQKIVRGYIAHILTTYPKDKRHLGTLYDLFVKGDIDGKGFDPQAVNQVIKDMAKNDAIGNSPADAAAVLSTLSDRDRSAHYSSISRGLDWVNDPLVRKTITAHSTFSLKECKTKDASVFIIIPEKYLVEMSRFLTLFYTVAFDTLDEQETEQRTGSKRRVLFLFDEFEVMGNFEPARQAALRKRASYIKCWYVVQNFGQFKVNYSNLQDFFGNSDKQFFGIDSTDTEITEIICKALGSYTQTQARGEGASEEKIIPLMSSGQVSKFLDAARNGQLVIPVQGLPLRLHRVPYYKNFGRRYKTA